MVATKKTTEITVSGNKKISTLQKEFNKKFPFIRICLFTGETRKKVAKGESISQLNGDLTLASVRRADSGGTISISGNKHVKTLEKEFDEVFGLYCQVCCTTKEGERYYTSEDFDKMTLSAFNEYCEKNQCKKNEWR